MSEPSLQPDREEQIRQISAYLQQHRAQYDEAALRKQLLDSGYPNAAVDEAIRRIDGDKPSEELQWPRLVGCGLSVGNYLLISLVGWLIGSTFLNNGYMFLAAPALVLGGELIVGVIPWRGQRMKMLGQILVWGVVWTVISAVVLAALIAVLIGICIALYSPQF